MSATPGSKWDGIEELSHLEYVDEKEMEEIINRVKGGGEAGEAGDNMGTDIEDMGTDIEWPCPSCRESEWIISRNGEQRVVSYALYLHERALNKAKTREIKRLNYMVRTLVDSMI